MKTKSIILALGASLLLFVGCSAYNNNANHDNKMIGNLSDKNGMALYTFDKDVKNKSNCYNICENKWPVAKVNVDTLKLPNGVSKDDFGTITRNNGAMQSTYKSKPLYYFFKDVKANDVNGDGLKGVWHIVK